MACTDSCCGLNYCGGCAALAIGRYSLVVADSPANLGLEIVAMCEAAGFARAGVCAADSTSYAQHVRQWFADGKHGDMAYLAKHAELRIDPAQFVPGVRSFAMVADQYASRNAEADLPIGIAQGKIARYARGKDYHKVVKKKLHALCDTLAARFPQETFRAFVDTAPVLEREHAARAGIGWVGKNTLLINPKLGSYFFLGGIATTLAIPIPTAQQAMTDHCGTCTRCIDACPTHAITPYSVDAQRCVSYLTIERREAIDPALFSGMQEWLYGCDICQEVCPHNSPRPGGMDESPCNPAYEQTRTAFDLLDVLGWNAKTRQEALVGSAMKRATLPMWRRNAVIVAGEPLRSTDDLALRTKIGAIAHDKTEDPIVRQAARDVLETTSGT